jgi:signal transduction histidine kinase
MEKVYADKVIAIIISTLVVVILAVFTIIFFILFTQKKRRLQEVNDQIKAEYEQELLQSQVEVQEATITMLSKELHDNVGQLLSTAKMFMSIAEMNITDPPDSLISAKETLGKAIIELRTLAKTLNKEWLEQFSLIDNLDTEVKRIGSNPTTKVHLSFVEGLLIGKPEKQLILFRIIQEAIQNAIKHACAKNINIDISEFNRMLTISVKDDGIGFGPNVLPTGMGILNMKQRVRLLGGEINWRKATEGTEVVVTLPVHDEEKSSRATSF